MILLLVLLFFGFFHTANWTFLASADNSKGSLRSEIEFKELFEFSVEVFALVAPGQALNCL